MRRSVITGVALALSFAGVAAAQQSGTKQPPRDQAGEQRGPGGRRAGPGGPGGLLFKDITLTDAQKTQLKQLRESQHGKMQANRDAMKKQVDEMRAARERGDTAAVRAFRERNRVAMEQARTQEMAAIRNVLTADQRIQFDKNVAELKQRQAERGARSGKGGKGEGRGRRGGHAGAPGQG